MQLKQGVIIEGIHPRMWEHMLLADVFWRRHIGYELVATSIVDGKHTARRSDHYSGTAFDGRTWTGIESGKQMSPETRGLLLNAYKDFMGDDFYIVDEGTHWHTSWRPMYHKP